MNMWPVLPSIRLQDYGLGEPYFASPLLPVSCLYESDLSFQYDLVAIL